MIFGRENLLKRLVFLMTLLCGSTGSGMGVVWAEPAHVVDAHAACSGHPHLVCQFTVTVRHADEGPAHYADKWEILSLDGTLLQSRKLHHPHIDEQPFTRSISGVSLSSSIKQVRIRAHVSQHGYGGKELILDLPQ